ncbi:N-formylglutamate amidohydrolase [Kytococcus schroeteri]|uniref:N-formylglutamate amidohydrolase n=3 Tax=Kytococcus TaxID=57499 RepID=A0A2I1PAI2_9MICO|nr:N-formylglutamate amidohydrolase [Kytococcus schroeteri]PKZ41628.1 N-formylglutamate amidohydrolase [Kytococcus schroeteri]
MTENPTHELVGDFSGQLVGTSIHAGHGLREETAAAMVLDEDTRFREEDPFTDRIAAGAPARVLVHHSRFEVDLNRPREEAVYRSPEDAWGLDVWADGTLDEDVAARSLEQYDRFYADLAERLDELAARGPFVVYDVHSYNHRRNGADAEPEPVEENPQVNLGTGTVDAHWRPVVDAFTRSLGSQEVDGERIDVRENVKFEGRALAWFVHERYPSTGLCLALEFKKLYMDEWTGRPDDAHVEQLQRALTATHEPVLAALREVGTR